MAKYETGDNDMEGDERRQEARIWRKPIDRPQGVDSDCT
jgi:hypothetical protein